MPPSATWVLSDTPAQTTDGVATGIEAQKITKGTANITLEENSNQNAKLPSNGHRIDERPCLSAADKQSEIPIAIVGMACRLSGDVSTPDEFWELCSRARSGWSEIPKERFNNASFHHPNPGKSGCHNPIGGHFLKENLGLFDAQFFNITAQEAISLDPQQRILLECTFEALENGGIPKQSIVGQDVGVFIGGSFSDYDLNNFRDPDTVPMYQATGCAFSLQANRISHFFDLRGPSVALDTACSSSLSALHMACQSLRSGESSQALVGGCHLNILPEYWISMSMSRLFSDEGKSYSFDNRGTGYGRGEGCGMIVLKPLADAIMANDAIRAVIRGTGINQDGRTPGITMPSGSAQEALIRSVYRNACIDLAETGFVEAHGTGTKVGDPIEASALNPVFGKGRDAKNPLLVGSVKSNVGHLEGASGIISVIKAAMMLEKGFILPNIGFVTPNEKIPFKEWNMKVPTNQRPWPRGKRFASINNFGFGGTNAHVVLERAPLPPKPLAKDVYEVADLGWASPYGRKLYVLSANDRMTLEAKLKGLGVYLEQRPEIFQNALMGNLAYTLGQRRSILPWRVAVPAISSFELVSTLSSAGLVPTRETEVPRTGFVFTGQGAQWFAMGRELFSQFPVFAATLRSADSCLAQLGCSFSLIDELAKEADMSAIGEAHISQPSCTAIQLALTDLLSSWGVHPTAVTGHSSGEIAAAYAAGSLSLESCMKIAYYRGSAIASLKSKHPKLKGSMMAIGSSAEEIRPLLVSLRKGEVKIACINSPSSVTVSGDAPAMSELQELVEEKQMFNRKLRVDVAYHSHHMNLVAKEYRSAIEGLKPLPNMKATFHSSLLGCQVEGSDLQPAYWVENLTCSVKFSEALQSMCGPVGDLKSRVNMIVEIGPHSALEGPIKQTLKIIGGAATKITYGPTLIRNKDATETMLQLAASMFIKGVSLDFAAINFPRRMAKPPVLLTDMPRYPWNHSTKYWHDSRMTEKHRFRTGTRNDVLGTLANYSNDLEPTWRNIIRTDDLPWLRHHQFQGVAVYPMSGYIVMAMEAASQRAAQREIKFQRLELREITVSRPLIITDNDIETTITLRSYQEGTRLSSDEWDEFRICSWTKEKGWIEHCRGLIATKMSIKSNSVDDSRQIVQDETILGETIAQINGASSSAVDSKIMYESLSILGATYGPTFQGFNNCQASDTSSVADIIVADTTSCMPMGYQSDLIIHPAFLDQLIQMYWPILGAGRGPIKTCYMPSFIGKMSISMDVSSVVQKPGDKLRAFCCGNPSLVSPKATNMTMFATAPDNAKEALIVIDNLTISPIPGGEMLSRPQVHRELCYKLDWELVPKSRVESSPYPDLEIAIVVGEANQVKHLGSNIAHIFERVTGNRPTIGTLHDINPVGKYCIFLGELESPFLAEITAVQFVNLQKMFSKVEGILWVVHGSYKDSKSPNSNIIAGLSRTIRSETLLKFATLDLDGNSTLTDLPAAEKIAEVFNMVFAFPSSSIDAEMEFMERDGQLYTPRIIDDAEMNKFVHQEINEAAPELQPFAQEGRPLKMAIASPGALDTLHFIDDRSFGTALRDDEVEIEIKATSMNFKDVMIAMGQLSSDYLGIECSGIVTAIGNKVVGLAAGDRVAAMTEGGYATYTRCKATSAFQVPVGMSFQAAATIPVVYCTAYYGLFDLGRLCHGERVLIHAAAGGVGQAAILLSKMVGAEIFATVGSAEKKEFIMKEYSISEDHIFCSRNTSFAKAIKRATNNRGVDVVLNSLAGDFLRETWDCLSHFGRFVEIGKRDIMANTRLEMARFEYNATFASVDLTVIAAERPLLMKRLLSDVFSLFDTSKIRVVSPITVFPISDVEVAFRSLQSGKVHGKLVIVPSPEDQVQAIPPKTSDHLFQSNATYVIIGGTGGLGRSITRWMVSKGAKHVVLLSRSGTSTGKVGELVCELGNHGAEIMVHRCDAADRHDVEMLVTERLRELPPIRGVIHSAMVLHDVLFEKMTHEQYVSVINAKVPSAWNFHSVLTAMQTPLEFFITISSAAGAVGNRGQAAYAAANTFLNAFVQYRLHLGLPATSIDLTAISDVGYLAENAERKAAVAENLGSDNISEVEVLALLSAAITGKMMGSCSSHCITGMRIPPPPATVPFWAHDAKFRHLLRAAEAASAQQSPTAAQKVLSLSSRLKSASVIEDAEDIVCKGLVDKVATVLMLEKDEIDMSKSVSSYGLDSLVAIEIRNFITREFETNLQVLELLTSGPITALAKTICGKSKLVSFGGDRKGRK